MKKFIGILLALYLLTFLFGADQVNFPDIYIDESVAPGGVGSLADPYSDFSEINWTTGGNNSIFDWYAGAEDASVTINLQEGEEWREQLTVGESGSATYPIIIGAYGSGADPIINAADLITPGTSWSASGATVTPSPVASADDGWTRANDSSVGDGGAALILGLYSALPYGCFVRVVLNVAKDATITAAKITFTCDTSRGDGAAGTISAWDTDDGAIGSVWANWVTAIANKTTADAAWDLPATTAETEYDTPSLTAIVQEIVDRAGWVSGQHIVFLFEDNSSSDYFRSYSWDEGNSKEAVVTVTYGTANVWQATLTTEPSMVFFDGNRGTKQASTVACDAEFDWYWAANVLYVYSTGDPDDDYTNPGIEANGARNYCVSIITKDYITVDGLEVRYSEGDGGVYVYNGSDYVTIQNCNFYYTFASGFFADENSTYLTLDNLYFYKCGYNAKENNLGSETIWISDGSSNYTVKNCEIDSCHAAGINLWGADDGVVENNYIHGQDPYDTENWLGGVYFDKCNDCIARYNKVVGYQVGYIVNAEPVGSTSDGIDFYYNIASECNLSFAVTCDQGDKDISNITVYNNVFHRDQSDYMDYDVFIDDVNILNFKNNIIICTETSSDNIMMEWANNTSNITLDNNCWYHVESRYHFDCGAQGYFATVAAYQAGTGEDANAISSDPRFIDVTSNDYRLLMASPCINAGTDVGLTTDYRGRSIRHAPDIGAYEDPTNVLFLTKLFEYLKERK